MNPNRNFTGKPGNQPQRGNVVARSTMQYLHGRERNVSSAGCHWHNLCMDHLDRVLAGCCWEVHATRAECEESLSSIRLVSKRLTMLLASYLAKEVAAVLREILTHPTKKLYDDNTAHLLCSNYWLQPIYQELLHSLSRYNATGNGEKNRPSNGLARISAHPRPPKKLKPAPLAPDSPTGLEVCAMRILCRFGSLPIQPL